MKHIILQLHITGRCNLRCRHCYIEQYAQEMSFWQIKNVLRQFDILLRQLEKQAHQTVIGHLHLTGGEPFLHQDITKILRLLKKKPYYVAIMSNGTLLNDRFLKALKRLRLKSFQVSLDGNEESHDAIRGAGNYKQVLAAMELLRNWEIPVRVSFTANKNNYKLFSDVVAVCREMGVKSVWSDRYVPIGPSEIETLEAADMPQYVQILAHERKNEENIRKGLCVENFRALQFIGSEDTPYSCKAGETLITIDEYGNVFPCRRLPLPSGNIRQTTLSDIYFNSTVFTRLREHNLMGKCLECSFRDSCKGGARCISYAVTGNFESSDPCCYLCEGAL